VHLPSYLSGLRHLHECLPSRKIFEKEYYIEHPEDYKLHLVDDTDKLIATAILHSQKDKVFRVITGHYNGQKMIVTKIDYEGDILNILISGD